MMFIFGRKINLLRKKESAVIKTAEYPSMISVWICHFIHRFFDRNRNDRTVLFAVLFFPVSACVKQRVLFSFKYTAAELSDHPFDKPDLIVQMIIPELLCCFRYHCRFRTVFQNIQSVLQENQLV